MAKVRGFKAMVRAVDKNHNAKVKVYNFRSPKLERQPRPGQPYPSANNDA